MSFIFHSKVPISFARTACTFPRHTGVTDGWTVRTLWCGEDAPNPWRTSWIVILFLSHFLCVGSGDWWSQDCLLIFHCLNHRTLASFVSTFKWKCLRPRIVTSGGECSPDEYTCGNTRCISRANVCDGVCDCGCPCEDENNCGKSLLFRQRRIQDFGQGALRAQWSFDPRGAWAQNFLKIGGFPLKLPENCMIWKKKTWGKGGWPPGPRSASELVVGLWCGSPAIHKLLSNFTNSSILNNKCPILDLFSFRVHGLFDNWQVWLPWDRWSLQMSWAAICVWWCEPVLGQTNGNRWGNVQWVQSYSETFQWHLGTKRPLNCLSLQSTQTTEQIVRCKKCGALKENVWLIIMCVMELVIAWILQMKCIAVSGAWSKT